MLLVFNHSRRTGSIIPLIAVSVVGLFAFVALAVDLGMLAVSRTQSQNAADIASLVGCRTLNNQPDVVNNDLALAVAMAKSTTTSNVHLSTNFTDAQIQKIEAGQYLYNATTQQFQVSSWVDVTNNQDSAPQNGSWTAIRVTLAVSQPAYFMKVFGVATMPTGAVATAVYRPRDTAFVLDMTGSMGYASRFNYNNRSQNPDNLVPTFGHYISTQNNLIATTNQTNTSGEAFSMNNISISTPGGLPIIRNFYFDTSNSNNPVNSAFPVEPANLVNAFHRWSPAESGGDASNYVPPTYDFTGYDAFDTTNTKGPTPAPDTFKTMTDSTSITYVGDRWRRANGSINKTDTTWATGNSTTRLAANAVELLGYNVSGSNVRGGVSGSSTIAAVNRFRDPIWEEYGYDLDIEAYRAAKGNNPPLDPGVFNSLVPAQDRFKGYSMGPGYWGKTFYIWPPDPRAPIGDPGDGNYVPGDWRRRYFANRNGQPFDPESNSNPNSSTDTAINQVLLNASNGLTVSGIGSAGNPNWRIDYPAILKWIKSGPMVLPPNLRAGRVLYYSSIPDDVNTSTGSTQVRLDKVFWKNYIDFVIGWNNTSAANLYGHGDSWSGGGRTIFGNSLVPWTGPNLNWPNRKPYMRYNDAPNRPRLHLWFGPMSMVGFISQGQNWLPGNCYEAQCWQLKAGMNSVIDDVRNNRPNDLVGMTMFAGPNYNGPRVAMGQNYNMLKNALFYPKSLLEDINNGDSSVEIRPYNINFTAISPDEIPNAAGYTDPNTGLAYAYNLLSPSSLLPTNTYGTLKGRRGASKVVIFETDGVPNAYRGISSGTRTMNPVARGYDSYYPNSGWASGNLGNGNATSMNEAIKVVNQIVKPMATSAANGVDSGLSLPNAPARVYAIAFGDLFDADASPDAVFRTTALQFMANIAAAGNTGLAGASTIPDHQIITGPYEQRIDRLRDAMQRIFKAGVSVSLIE
jgi:hypothetical protein